MPLYYGTYLFLLAYFCITYAAKSPIPPLEFYHNPAKTKTPRDLAVFGGDRIHDPAEHQDYRDPPELLGPQLVPGYDWAYTERNRPYRLWPFKPMLKKWKYMANWDNPEYLGCYCVVTYKRVVPLAGCAVITIRHILTSAWPTHNILQRHSHSRRMLDILGWWYNIDDYKPFWNTTRYMTPARIHFHPAWLRPEETNTSHPFPVIFDLAVYTGLFPMHWNAHICQRAVGNWGTYHSTHYTSSTIYIVIGSQFMLAYNRRPTPFHLYGVRTIDVIAPCPKADWAYFMCFGGRWAPLGLDSGAPLHQANNQFSQWSKYDGLLAINSFSMKLRSNSTVHYFTEVNNHPVLDFLYDAYMGTLKYEFLDERYADVHYGPLTPYKWFYIPWKQNEPLPTRETEGSFFDG